MTVQAVSSTSHAAASSGSDLSLTSLAEAGGSNLNSLWSQMQALMSKTDPASMAKLGALSSEFQMAADAINNAIKSIGQGDSTLASKA